MFPPPSRRISRVIASSIPPRPDEMVHFNNLLVATPPHRLRMFSKRIHQCLDLLKPARKLFGGQLFVRKGDLRHLRGVKNPVVERERGSAAVLRKPPTLDCGLGGDFSDVLPLAGSLFDVGDEQRRQRANRRSEKRGYFWGY